MADKIEVKRGLFGQYVVHFGCPGCRARLKSPLKDAGKSDECPYCNASFQVPGAEERDRLAQEMDLTNQRKREEAADRKKQSDQLRTARIQAAERGSPVSTAKRDEPLTVAPPIVKADRLHLSSVQGAWIIVLLFALLGIQLAYFVRQLVSETEPPKWEYMIASPPDVGFDDFMDDVGARGWELVSARRATSSSESESKPQYEMIFRRQKVR